MTTNTGGSGMDQGDRKTAEFIGEKRVLIVDTDSAAHTTCQRMLATMGIKSQNVMNAWTFQDAVRLIEQNKPEIVLSEYVIDRNSGLELLNLHKRIVPDRLQSVFIFLSTRNSNTIACLAAAEEVDAFLIKPFSFVALKDKFFEIVTSKAYVSDYSRELEKARLLLRQKNPAEALVAVEAAKKLDGAPALACALKGMILLETNRAAEAEKCFSEGLDYNPVHYLCLTQMLAVLIKQGRNAAAYQTAHKLSQNYPIEPRLIPTLIRLAIATQNFGDVLRYYDLFEDLDEKEPTVVNYVSAGLIVCAKYFIENGRTTDGLNALNKAEAVSDRKPQIVKEILTTLFGAGLEAEANALLERSPTEVKNSPEVAAAKLEKLNGSAPPTRVLQHALDLVGAGVRHPRIFEIALTRSVELMHREHEIRQLLALAVESFPARKAAFEKLTAPGSGGETPDPLGMAG